MDWTAIISSILEKLGVPLLTGLFAILGGYYANKQMYDNSRKSANELQKRQNNSLLRSLRAELQGLNTVLESQIEQRLIDSQDYFNWIIPVDTDYFPVYHAHLDKIGNIPDSNLTEKIISVYMAGQLFVDCLKTNNRLCNDAEEASRKIIQCPTEARYWKEQHDWIAKNLEMSKRDNITPAYEDFKSKLTDLIKSIKIDLEDH